MMLIRKKQLRRKNEIMKPRTDEGVNPHTTTDGEHDQVAIYLKLRLTTYEEVTITMIKTPNYFASNILIML
jgi:hypothetical protein